MMKVIPGEDCAIMWGRFTAVFHTRHDAMKGNPGRERRDGNLLSFL